MFHCWRFPWHVSLRPPEVTVLFMYLLPWAFGILRSGQTLVWQIDKRHKVVVIHWFTATCDNFRKSFSEEMLRYSYIRGVGLHQEASIQTSRKKQQNYTLED